ncbi:hypothetical protein [Chitinophaga polysaccharea]|uniref:hypothetical protein n=1 Tax=Chitinophaga polysaccharea TaxID=1293035 RepID=UPI00115B11F7|nr:hypothetical protein [Chitinophaga polysaccharea]
MSYDIQLYSTETKAKEQQSGDKNFFDNKDNLVPFSKEQVQQLKERLINYDYILEREDKNGLTFRHAEYGISALLTGRGLYFTAGWGEENIFEAGMAASEFTDSGEFEKYDPQNGGWEEF